MNNNRVIDRLFENKVQEAGISLWRTQNKKYQGFSKEYISNLNVLNEFIENILDNNQLEKFNSLFENFKTSLFVLNYEENRYFFTEGYKDALKFKNELM